MGKGFRISFRLYLRGDASALDKPSRLDVWIHLDSARLNLGSTGYRLCPSAWDVRGQRALPASPDAESINAGLQRIHEDIIRIYYGQLSAGSCTLESVKLEWQRGRAGRQAWASGELYLPEAFERYMRELASRGKEPAYVDSHRCLLRDLESYMSHLGDSLPLSALSPSFVLGFREYMEVGRGYKASTVHMRLRMLKSVLAYAAEELGYPSRAYHRLRLRKPPSMPRFLPDESVEMLASVCIRTPLEARVRDMFFFALYTGLAWAELSSLRADMLVRAGDTTHLFLSRRKTGRELRVLLIAPALALVERYAGLDEGGLIFPRVSHRHALRVLDRLRERAGLPHPLSFHMARHTFATRALSAGVPIASVSRMLGHADIRTTQIYACITDTRLEEDMRRVEESWVALGGVTQSGNAGGGIHG